MENKGVSLKSPYQTAASRYALDNPVVLTHLDAPCYLDALKGERAACEILRIGISAIEGDLASVLPMTESGPGCGGAHMHQSVTELTIDAFEKKKSSADG